MKIGILISEKKDFLLLKETQTASAVFIAHNEYIRTFINECELPLFYPESTGADDLMSMLHFLCDNWYRDQSQNAVFLAGKISLGQALHYRLMLSVAEVVREYQGIQSWLTKVDCLYVRQDVPAPFKQAATFFADKIKYYKSETALNKHYTAFPHRGPIVDFPPVHPLSHFMRQLQHAFKLKNYKRRTLIFRDWTLLKQKSAKNALFFNAKCCWQGFYFSSKPTKKGAEKIFPLTIPPYLLDADRLNKMLRQSNFFIEGAFISIFIASLVKEYEMARAYFVRAYAKFLELFEYYQPTTVVFNSAYTYSFVIAQQIAKNRKIKTILLQDGIPTFALPFMYYRNHQTYLFDYFFAFNASHVKLLQQIGINKNTIIPIKSPITAYYKRNKTKQKQYDAMILYPAAHARNPHARWDLRFHYVVEVMKILIDQGFKNIAIKLRSGDKKFLYSKKHYRTEAEKLEELMINTHLSAIPDNIRIHFVYGQLYESVHQAEMLIGQLSTALVESFFAKIPYYVYEPVEMGLTDKILFSSPFVQTAAIARTTESLKQLILKKYFVKSIQSTDLFLIDSVRIIS